MPITAPSLPLPWHSTAHLAAACSSASEVPLQDHACSRMSSLWTHPVSDTWCDFCCFHVQRQKLDLMILVGTFQLRIIYDSLQQQPWGVGRSWLTARQNSLCPSCTTELFCLNTWHLGKSGQWNNDALKQAILYSYDSNVQSSQETGWIRLRDGGNLPMPIQDIVAMVSGWHQQEYFRGSMGKILPHER